MESYHRSWPNSAVMASAMGGTPNWSLSQHG
jgi:hypothetical protein